MPLERYLPYPTGPDFVIYPEPLTYVTPVADPDRFTQAGVADSTVHACSIVLALMLKAEVRN